MSVALFHKNADQPPKKRWWNNQELAEFYRVSDIMAHAGLKVESESGVSDEGEPWFAFVRADTEEVIAHFAKIDDVFIAVSSVTQDIYRGSDVRDLINQLLERHPLMTPPSNNGRVVLHPRMVLVAFVAAAFVAASEEVKANTIDEVLSAVLSENTNIKNIASNEITDTYIPDSYLYENSNIQKTVSNKTINFNIPDHIEEKETNLTTKNLAAHASNTYSDVETGKQYGNSIALISAVILALEISSRETALANSQSTPPENYSQELQGLLMNEYFPVPGLLETESTQVFNSLDINSDSSIVNFVQSVDSFTVKIPSSAKENTTNGSGSSPEMPGVKSSLDLALYNSANNMIGSDGILPKAKLFVDDNTETNTYFFQELNLDQINVPLQNISIAAINVVDLVNEAIKNVSGDLNETSLKFNKIIMRGNIESYFSQENTTVKSWLSLNPTLAVQDQDSDEPLRVKETEPELSNSNNSSLDILPTLDIKGHLLDGTNNREIFLNDSIDVLLYEGGSAVVTGFELGKDRIWFFLSDDKKSYENYRITENNDLILEFSSGDTLTLLGVLETDNSSSTLL